MSKINSTVSLQKGLGLAGSILGAILGVMELFSFIVSKFSILSITLIFISILGIIFSILYESNNMLSSIMLIICSILFIFSLSLPEIVFSYVTEMTIISTLLTFSSGIIGITSEFRKK